MVLNSNKSVDINKQFIHGNQIVNFNVLLFHLNRNLQIINDNRWIILTKIFFYKTIIQNRYIFLITKNNYLVAVNLMNSNIIYSYNINKKNF